MCNRLKREDRVQSDLERIAANLKEQIHMARDDETRRALLDALEILKRVNAAAEVA
jgi:hypothetical protein